MKKLLVLFLLGPVFHLQAQDIYFPPLLGDTWETLSPDSLGWCEEEIAELYDFLEDEQTKSFMVLKDGRIVLERYFGNYTQDSLYFWFSAGKSLMSTLVGIAQEEGMLDINDPTSDYLGTGWTSMTPSQEAAVTVWHQLTMTTGLDESDFFCSDPACLVYLADPGTRWFYHNGPYSLLRNVVESATGQTINQYMFNRVSLKTGMTGFWVPVGFNNFYLSKARDMARFGLTIQNGGFYGNTPVLGDNAYLQAMINTSQNLNPSYGYLWWLNGKTSFIPPGIAFSIPGFIAPDAPADVYTAAGADGQYISVSPGSGLLMIRQGGSNDDDLAALTLHNNIWKRILELDCTLTSIPASEKPGVVVYPNPANDRIQVRGVDASSAYLLLYSLTGETLREVTGTLEMELGGLSSGLYLLEIREKDQVIFRKVIVE